MQRGLWAIGVTFGLLVLWFIYAPQTMQEHRDRPSGCKSGMEVRKGDEWAFTESKFAEVKRLNWWLEREGRIITGAHGELKALKVGTGEFVCGLSAADLRPAKTNASGFAPLDQPSPGWADEVRERERQERAADAAAKQRKPAPMHPRLGAAIAATFLLIFALVVLGAAHKARARGDMLARLGSTRRATKSRH